MHTNYAFSEMILPSGSPTSLDLLLQFRAEEAPTSQNRRPLNLCLVIDRSGSMAGLPLRHAVQAAKALVNQLRSDDILSVVVYDDSVDTIVAPQAVTNPQAIRDALDYIRPGGCTNLSGGWLRGCEHVAMNKSDDLVQRVLLLTDGQANAGVKDPRVLINSARQKAEDGIITTTLGFGNHFNEDLLIGMAQASRGNFYYIQSPEDAADVFTIELQSLTAIAAQNLTVTIETVSGATVERILSNYRQESTSTPNHVVLTLGDVYSNEDKRLALTLGVPGHTVTDALELVKVSYAFETASDEGIQQRNGELVVSIPVGTIEEAMAAYPATDVIAEISKIRIATAKDQAIEQADRGDSVAAGQTLRTLIADLRQKGLHERFEIAEELDQLEFFAERIERRQLDNVSRKEMRDQSFQAQSRNRADLSLRGTSSGAAQGLPTVTEVGEGVELEGYREGGKVRIRVVSDGYNTGFNVQFPRAIRDEGIHYVVDSLELSADGTFYRAVGAIKRLRRPGEPDRYTTTQVSRTPKTGKASVAPPTAADLETTDTIGDGVLVQCIKEGSKLRARVVSDGYDPDWNMRFPRSIREEGLLYVVDEVITISGGGQYQACGKIRRFVQK